MKIKTSLRQFSAATLLVGGIFGLAPDANAVRFRLPLASNNYSHYYMDHGSGSLLRDWKCQSETYNGHLGTDFGAPRNTAIYSGASGTLAAKQNGWGDGSIGTDPNHANYAIVNHSGGFRTLYWHMQINTVTSKSVGSSIACGEQIGKVGMSGNASGPHLHFEVQINGVPDDPYAGSCSGSITYWVNQNNGNPTTACEGGGEVSSPIQLFSVSSDGLVTTGSDSAGRLVVFGLESDNTAGLMTQTSANGGWPSSWAGLGTWQHQMLAMGKNADSRLEILSIGSDNGCNRANQTSPGGSWSGWNAMGGWMTKIAVARNANGTQEIFSIGSDQKLYHTWQTSPNGGWHAGWTVMGNYQHKEVIVGQNADGRLEVFTIGTDNACNRCNQISPGGTWTGWSTLGGSFSSIGVGRNLDGRLEVFGINTSDQKLAHCWQMSANGNWHAGFDDIGSYQHKEFVVGQNADGRLEVFTIGTDNACNRVNQTTPNGNWSGWSGMGGSYSSLAVGRNADGRQELFAIGSSNKQMYHAYQTVPNGGWSAWLGMGGSFK